MHNPRILLASDLTARSDRAFDRAVRLAEGLNGSIVLVHVRDEMPRGGAPALAEMQRRIAGDLPETEAPVEIVVTTGSAPAAIAEIADQYRCDLIVVGVARYNSLGDYLTGTAVDHLVRRARMPVLVVKRRALKGYDNLLVATDFSPCSQRAAETAADLFPGARLTLVHSYTPAFPARLDLEDTRDEAHREASEAMAALTAAPSLAAARFDVRLEEGHVVAVIDRCVRALAIDLLVLGTHGRGGFAHATIGSWASELLSKSAVDILMVRGAR